MLTKSRGLNFFFPLKLECGLYIWVSPIDIKNLTCLSLWMSFQLRSWRRGFSLSLCLHEFCCIQVCFSQYYIHNGIINVTWNLPGHLWQIYRTTLTGQMNVVRTVRISSSFYIARHAGALLMCLCAFHYLLFLKIFIFKFVTGVTPAWDSPAALPVSCFLTALSPYYSRMLTVITKWLQNISY